MKTVKGLFLLLFFFSFLIQKTQAQVRIFGGPQLTSAKYSVLNVKQATEYKQGFVAGIAIQSLVEGPLFIVPTLYYSQKGYKVTFNQPSAPPDANAKNNNTTIHTIAFAPLFQVNLSKAKNHVFFRFGPGIDVAVSGREVFDSTGNKRVDRSLNIGSTGYSPATAFFNVQAGYEVGAFSISASYEHGLVSFNNADFGPTILHRIAGVSLGWKFGKK